MSRDDESSEDEGTLLIEYSSSSWANKFFFWDKVRISSMTTIDNRVGGETRRGGFNVLY
jgi:hypothetical protein